MTTFLEKVIICAAIMPLAACFGSGEGSTENETVADPMQIAASATQAAGVAQKPQLCV